MNNAAHKVVTNKQNLVLMFDELKMKIINIMLII